jgi:hypothetical protein
MIREQKIKELVHYSFNTNGDADYLRISHDRLDLFWDWFYSTANYYQELSGDKEYSDASFLRNRCIGNSQTAAVKHGLHYIEGFATSDKQSYLFHGFNLLNDQIVDVTVNSNPKAFEETGKLVGYLGVSIPLHFIMEKNAEVVNRNSLNIPPLLYLYFLANNPH